METYTAKFEYDNAVYEAEVTVRYDEYAQHTVHVWGQPDPAMDRPEYSMKCDAKGVVPGHEYRGCLNCERDAAWRRYNNAEVRVYKDVFAALFPDSPAKVGFSQKAGCKMCPCSPGLVVKDSYGDTRFPRYHSTYVKLTRLT